tara:strand:- start:3183 stop:3392 length:210 start_codon:yes stop_codon:yes gene_type:complete
MSDAPESLVDQLQGQRAQLEAQIQDLETKLMRAKEGYLKVLGALEFAAIQAQQAGDSTDSDTTTTGETE